MSTETPRLEPTPAPGAIESAPSRTFSAELRDLVEHFKDRPVRLGEIIEATQARGYDFVLVLLSLPFLTPLPLPGLSTPFGFVIALIGLRLAVGQRPWLPQRLLRHELSAPAFAKLLAASSRVMTWLEIFLRPRLGFVPRHTIFQRIAGAMTAIAGGLLALPVPVPFTNTLPAWTVMLLAAGALGRDGLFFFGGCAAFVTTLAYFFLLAFGGTAAVEKLWHLVAGT